MCSSINFILIILSYLCITTCKSTFGLEENVTHESNKSGNRHCYVKMALVDSAFMPIPFEGDYSPRTKFTYESPRQLTTPISKPKMIRPDKNGYLFFKHNSSYKLGCTEDNEFVSPTLYPVSEVTVECIDGSFKYAGKMYEFDRFRCVEIPRAKLYGTEIMCHKQEFGEIKKIGFQSRDTFLNLYRTCFDNHYNYTYYSWYYVNSPVYKRYQISNAKMDFIKTRETCSVDIDAAYKNLTNIMEKNLKAENLLDAYSIKNNFPRRSNISRHFIKRVFLIAEHEFVYAFEQQAAYFYENIAVQWTAFNNEVWQDFEKLFRRNMIKISGRHLIVVGTFFERTRLELSNGRNRTNRFSPYNVAVPEYFWKMLYNVDTKFGIVFIGVNKPNKRTDTGTVHICDTVPCPGRGLSSLVNKTELIYCCFKESFEKSYGELDSDVYEQFYYS